MSNHDESIEKLLSSDSFVEWIEGTATDEEGERWQAWIEDDPARKKLVDKAKVLHRNIAFRSGEHPEMEAELERLFHQFREEEQSSKPKIFQITRKTWLFRRSLCHSFRSCCASRFGGHCAILGR